MGVCLSAGSTDETSCPRSYAVAKGALTDSAGMGVVAFSLGLGCPTTPAQVNSPDSADAADERVMG